MMESKVKKRIKIVLSLLVGVLFLSIVSFVVYASYYYKAENIALKWLEKDSEIVIIDKFTIIPAAEPSDTALIFYPGAKVEAISYLPLLEGLKEKGVSSVLVEMPFNMAIFDSKAADEVFELLPEIENWYVGGHSMGGAMASSYASKNSNKIEGLILLGAYIYGDYPPEKTITIYGSFNSNLEKNIDYTDNIVLIEGGNHAQFGNYGEQKGDPSATISSQEQQDIAVQAIIEFIEDKQ